MEWSVANPRRADSEEGLVCCCVLRMLAILDWGSGQLADDGMHARLVALHDDRRPVWRRVVIVDSCCKLKKEKGSGMANVENHLFPLPRNTLGQEQPCRVEQILRHK